MCHRPNALVLVALVVCAAANAGPPFTTDDPEPVELHHWEAYIASVRSGAPSGMSGTLPHIELNNGIAPNTQLHLIMPYAFQRPTGGPIESGYGDTEIGVKFRFRQEGRTQPMAGVFPLVELPTGSSSRGLGSGHTQVFLPLWLQKSWGSWTSYGGGGYWINQGSGNRNYWLLGWQAQKDLSPKLTLGGELFYTTASTDDGRSQLTLNVGGQYNFDESHHLLVSVGHSITGDNTLVSYVAYQWTFGPRGHSAHAEGSP
jgi:hypothetical protein